jgi:hypothetical protein
LPFYDAPATNNLREAIAKCLARVQVDFSVSDDELEERLLISHQTHRNVRNRQNTLGTLAISRLGYFYGLDAIEPILALSRRHYAPEPETQAEKRRRLIRELAALEDAQ